MRERLKRVVLKTTVRETVPGVRIPLPPPLAWIVGFNKLQTRAFFTVELLPTRPGLGITSLTLASVLPTFLCWCEFQIFVV